MLVPLPFCQSRLSTIILNQLQMSSWTDVAGFCFAALAIPLTLLHLWAFIYPGGKISERLHHPSTELEDKTLTFQRLRALE